MKRVQRKRVKGYRMPPNTVYVGRPTRWGNPYHLWDARGHREELLILYHIWLLKQLEKDPSFLEPLRGKNLACWCPPDQPCHVDILLEYLEGKTCK